MAGLYWLSKLSIELAPQGCKEGIMSYQTTTSAPGSLRAEVLLVFAMFVSIFFLTSAGFDTSEGGYHYSIAHQIWTQHAMSFAEPKEGIYTVAPNGRTYASHEFGNTLFMLPIAGVNVLIEKALAHRMDQRKIDYITGFFLTSMSCIYCAITAALLYALLRLYFRKSMRTAMTACLAFVFCSFVWTFSRNLFDGVLCMALVTGAMLAMMEFRQTKDTRLFVLATALLGFGIITRLTIVIPLLGFAVYLAIVLWRDWARMGRLLLLGALVLAPFAAWQMYYNNLRTGNWLVSPVASSQYADSNGLTGNLAVGIPGLLFSPGKSVFLYLPLALISIVCFRRFLASYLPEAVYVAAVFVPWLLLHAKLATNWFGSWGFGPRHFISIAPILVLPALVEWEWLTQKLWRRILLFCALAWGAILSVSSIIGNWFFRMGLAHAQGREDDMLWSLTRGQALDMITGAALNIRNIIWHLPEPVVPGESPSNHYASTTINVWLNSAAYQGVPPILLVFVALLLIGATAYAAFALRQIALWNSHAGEHSTV
jgi:hypothetical protein